jgi:pilus assembly protein Flp/PilA
MFKQLIRRALTQNSEKGQGLVEYALILVLVAVVVIVVLALLGPAIAKPLGDIKCSLEIGWRGGYGTRADGATLHYEPNSGDEAGCWIAWIDAGTGEVVSWDKAY